MYDKFSYKGFDKEDAVEVAWVEYPHIPAHALTNFKVLRERLLALNCRNLMKYKHAWVDEKGDRVVFITDWTSSGNLLQYPLIYIFSDVLDISQKRNLN